MKRILVFVLALALLSACEEGKKAYEEGYEDGQEAVAELTIPELTIGQFDTDAGQYVDKQVKVAGIVDHVCKHSGKKLKIVTDDGSIHVESETRFDDALVGNQIQLIGVVREMRIDESYCLQMEEDNTKNHREGVTNEEQFSHKQKQIQQYRDSMSVAGVDHLSFYTLDFVSLEKDTD